MIPSLTDSDDTVCDDADELNQLCEMFCTPPPHLQHATAHHNTISRASPPRWSLTADDFANVADKRSWPPREQQDDAENQSPEMKTLLPSESNWQPDWALDGLGDGLDRGWPSMDARVAIDGQACFTDRTRVQAQRLTGPAGPIIATGMVDDGNSSSDAAADSTDEPVQTGILVACKSPDPQTGTSFSQRALHVITKCQDVLERNASGEHDVLLREIDEVRASNIQACPHTAPTRRLGTCSPHSPLVCAAEEALLWAGAAPCARPASALRPNQRLQAGAQAMVQ